MKLEPISCGGKRQDMARMGLAIGIWVVVLLGVSREGDWFIGVSPHAWANEPRSHFGGT